MNKAKTFKKNKKLRIFLLFLAFSFVFWMLIKLSREYTATAQVDLTYIDLPENKLFETEPLSKVNVTIESYGFNLLKYKFSNRKATVSLNKLRKKDKTTFYYLATDIFKDVNKVFSKGEVLEIERDTIYFKLSKSTSKKLKVEPNLFVQYSSGYNLSGKFVIDPEYITISGPENQVATITRLTTERLELKNVNDTIHKTLKIAIDKALPKIHYEATTITIRGKVEKYTERTLEIPFKVVNMPASYKINTFPKTVKVVFQIGLSDFNKITENDFNIVCDFSKVGGDGVNYLTPEILNKPSMVSEVKITPNKIEFLLEK
tara:strand:+ start:157523 stop:158473 length:951 start_codon:yes stop_codon:yes gene_type:complete